MHLSAIGKRRWKLFFRNLLISFSLPYVAAPGIGLLLNSIILRGRLEGTLYEEFIVPHSFSGLISLIEMISLMAGPILCIIALSNVILFFQENTPRLPGYPERHEKNRQFLFHRGIW